MSEVRDRKQPGRDGNARSEQAALPGQVEAGPARPAERPGRDSRIDLGQKLKQARSERGWTLEHVSRRTGVARSSLSKIENGQMSPTYDVLQKITHGMGLDLVELFDTRHRLDVLGRRSVTLSGRGKQYATPTYDYELLATELSHKRMQPFRVRIRARRFEDFEDWVRHDGEEFILVLSGQVEVLTEFYAAALLGPGDSIYFDSKMGHVCSSLGPADAEVVCTCVGSSW
jgi:transcriptional regulator with XRE-family HTH domain